MPSAPPPASGDGGSSLPGRLARYARVAGTIGRFASRLAGERYLGVRHDPGELARELKDSLARLRGPVVKVAQLLATWGFATSRGRWSTPSTSGRTSCSSPCSRTSAERSAPLTGDIHGRNTAERVIAELHQAGGVDIPREFVIMDRAAIGLSAASSPQTAQ
jgi:hypothetical protein